MTVDQQYEQAIRKYFIAEGSFGEEQVPDNLCEVENGVAWMRGTAIDLSDPTSLHQLVILYFEGERGLGVFLEEQEGATA
jgi:hypothetical protein